MMVPRCCALVRPADGTTLTLLERAGCDCERPGPPPKYCAANLCCTAPCFGACDGQKLGALRHALAARGPASICVNAANWFDYVGGVMSAAACGSHAWDDLDHCVQVVGYNAR